jgi:N-acetylglucosaminyl-diphospho-decaprenol L-rhamnosyltransferase
MGIYSLGVPSSPGDDPAIEPTVAVVVLRLGSQPLSSGLTEALYALSSSVDSTVIIAENPDGGPVSEQSEPVAGETLRFDSNVGYATAINAAVRNQQNQHRHIIVLTSDIDLRAGSLSLLLDPFVDTTIGVVAPVVETGSETWIGGTWNKHWGWARHGVVPGRREDIGAKGETIETTWADGACLAMDRHTFDTVGGFDERTFLYSEDLLFCLKAQLLNKRVVITSNVVVRQESGVTKRSGAHGYLLIRNEILAARTVSNGIAIGAIASSVVRSWLELARVISTGQRRHHLRQSFGMAWGIFDALRGRYGPPPTRLAKMAHIPNIKRRQLQ